jgi:hypothetical protein
MQRTHRGERLENHQVERSVGDFIRGAHVDRPQKVTGFMLKGNRNGGW